MDVPRTLAAVKQEAKAYGFTPDSTGALPTHRPSPSPPPLRHWPVPRCAGVYQYLLKRAADQAQVEQQRLEAGVGGALRSVISKTRSVRGLSVVDVEENKPYRDPAVDTGRDSLLATRVHKAVYRMEQLMKGQKPM